MKDRVLALTRIVLGGLFVYAALTKIPNMTLFAQEMAAYRVFPSLAIPFLGAWVIGLELLVGALLMIGVAARGAALIVSGLLVLFIAALTQALLRGIDLNCGCFAEAEVANWWTVARDLVMLVGGIAILIKGPGRILPARTSAS